MKKPAFVVAGFPDIDLRADRRTCRGPWWSKS
jgi:hypothetical protein